MKFANTRQAMAWLHTWLGLIFGFVLMICFFFGALSVFDREIDRWAIPDTRFDPQPMPSFDTMLLDVFERTEPDVAEYNRLMPIYHDPDAGDMTPRTELPADEYWAYTTHRDPVLLMGIGFRVPKPLNTEEHNHIHGRVTIDPRSGEELPSNSLKIGSDWFYPLHYSLNLNWNFIGFYIVGIAAFFMLVALVSGVWIHRKIFREFFTFRREKKTQRATLDLHNMSGVVALPFHFFFALTGLIIFAAFYYLPVTNTMLKPLHNMHETIEADTTGLPHERSGIAASMASVDDMVSEAKRRWAARDMAGEVGFLMVHHVGDANSYVSIYRAGSDRVSLVGEGIHFKASNGEVLREDPPHSTAESIAEFLTGLHLQHFEHWFLRWLYVLGGLLGCVCIATGFIFFTEKRKQQHAKNNSQGSRIVDAFAITTVTGIVIAAVTMLLANRLLPADMLNKGDWEKWIFCIALAFSFLHATLRSEPVARGEKNPAWREQCLLIAGLSIAAVTANWLTTGDHLIKTIFTNPYWAVAGVDLSLLAVAATSWKAASHLQPETNKKEDSSSKAAYE
ncbi:PepSY-associated TM helix domain-containing protein [Thalassolituus oleivorans]|uniref:FIG138928: iron-regulated membrane protein n=1 Tax=hydrothermal vent metagenome TaxID=652676 RepID=A0A160T9Z9_9ZZZZ|nr:PepSY-associated TM helix domain-containing protein [Thalassolituus oleivorans]AHK16068.1 peptidase [Thalassolituus oleivorans R6-15]